MLKTCRLTILIAIITFASANYAYSQDNSKCNEAISLLKSIKNLPADAKEQKNLNYQEALILSQKCGDSLKASIYLGMGLNYSAMSDSDSAKWCYEKGISLLEKQHDYFALKSTIFRVYADLLNGIGKKDTSRLMLNTAIDYARSSGDSSIIISALSDLARYKSNDNENKEAIELLQIIKEYRIRHNETDYLKNILNQLGVCYFRIQAVESARETFLEGLALDNDDKVDQFSMRFYNNLGQLHRVLLHDLDSAIYYYEKARDISLIINNDYSWLVAMLNLGNCYEALEKNQKAEEIYLQVLRSDNISAYFNVETAVTINLGIIYYNLKQYENAKFYIDEGTKMAQEGKYLDFEINALENKIKLDVYFHDLDAFEEHFVQYFTLVDSTYGLTHNAEINELKVQYETEKAVQENENLKEKDELNKEMIKKQRTMLWVMICSIMVLISLLIFIFNLNKKQKKLTENLHQSNITKDKLFSIIGHDLKSPMSSILTTLTILDDDEFDLEKDQFKAIVGELKLNVENSTMLLSNLLQWSQNQRQGIQNNPGTTNLETEIQQVISFLKNKIEEKELHLECNINKDQIVWCESQLLSNTLLNIINNAIKFTDPKGNISVDATVENEMIHICVSDDGVGIPLEHQDKLFRIETGYHTDGTANEKGTGLGLAMCKEYVDAMGGEISVKSEPGVGSTFCFTIPAIKNA